MRLLMTRSSTTTMANALVISYKERYSFITFTISVLGAFTSAGFFCFDLRNRGLVRLAGDILERLENENIFPPVGKEKSKLGYISRDRKFMGEGKKLSWKAKLKKHKWGYVTLKLTFVRLCAGRFDSILHRIVHRFFCIAQHRKFCCFFHVRFGYLCIMHHSNFWTVSNPLVRLIREIRH